MLVPGWVSSRSAEGVRVVWERELAAGGWSKGGEPEEEVASGVVGVWEQVLGELGLVGSYFTKNLTSSCAKIKKNFP